jgi:hypothetical protein
MYDSEGYGRTVGYFEYSSVAASNVLDNAADPTGLVTVATAVIYTSSYPVGLVEGAFVLADCDPPVTNVVALFEVVPIVTVVSITAEKASGSTSDRIVEGDDVRITVTFNIEPFDGVMTLVNASGATIVTNAAMALSGTSLTCEYTTTSNDVGWVSASFGFDAAMPATTNCVNLFRVWPRPNLMSVATYDASGVETNSFVAGDKVTIVVTFDKDAYEEGSAIISNAAGAEMTNAVMAVSGSNLTFRCATTMADVGWASGRFSFIDSDPAATNIVDLFEVLDPAAPPPTEEYEEVPWRFTSITVTNSVATLAWATPTANVATEGDYAGKCNFRVEWRQSLTSGAWSASGSSYTVTGVNSAAGCVKSIQLSGLGNPAHCFFRLIWTNKVKE